MRRSLDVGVTGCGTVGSAAALSLPRVVPNVTVDERVSEPKAVGAGIVLVRTSTVTLVTGVEVADHAATEHSKVMTVLSHGSGLGPPLSLPAPSCPHFAAR